MPGRTVLFCLVLMLLPRAAWSGPIRVSVASDGTEGNNNALSERPSLSSDGRYVAFESAASNLVPGDTNNAWDIFVHDRQTGTTERVSVASDGAEADSLSYSPSLSADGRYVAFSSNASNLVPGDTNGVADIFVHDRQTGMTERVSVASDGTEGNTRSSYPVIWGDGRYVAFSSDASNLVTDDTNNSTDIFIHDRQTGTTERVSVASNGAQGNNSSDYPSTSADGRYVAFESIASNLVPGDTNGARDVFVRDRQTGTTEPASVASGGAGGNGHSYFPSLSADGRYVVFYSQAFNLVPQDSNGIEDVFVHDRQTGTTERVSVSTGGAEGNGTSAAPSVSADGRYVAFYSSASNLVFPDFNNRSDTFVHDRQTGTTERLSIASDGVEGDDNSSFPALSADGRYVAFPSFASNLVTGDTNASMDVFETENTLYSAPDSDGDGVPDSSDGCPSDAQKTAPGACGCGTADTDSDGDSVPDCNDSCPSDPSRFASGAECGSGDPNTDTDGDGTPDNLDVCPNDPNKSLAGATGCGALDPLTPTTVLEEYPRLIVKGKNVAVWMERFAGVIVSAAAGPRVQYVVELRPMRRKSAALSSSQGAQRRISRKNNAVFRRLKPGTYQVRYLVQAVQKRKVLFQTNWSPAAQVTAGKK